MSKVNEIASRSFSEIVHSENATRVLHLMMHKLMGEGCDYDAAHRLLFIWYSNHTSDFPLTQVKKYIQKVKRRLATFKKHRPLLLDYLQANDFTSLEIYVYWLSAQGYSKKKIYDIFNDFFVFVEYHHAYSTEQADKIADYILDRLSGWSKDRLLPEEPDVQ